MLLCVSACGRPCKPSALYGKPCFTHQAVVSEVLRWRSLLARITLQWVAARRSLRVLKSHSLLKGNRILNLKLNKASHPAPPVGVVRVAKRIKVKPQVRVNARQPPHLCGATAWQKRRRLQKN